MTRLIYPKTESLLWDCCIWIGEAGGQRVCLMSYDLHLEEWFRKFC